MHALASYMYIPVRAFVNVFIFSRLVYLYTGSMCPVLYSMCSQVHYVHVHLHTFSLSLSVLCVRPTHSFTC